ncbi:COMM domain-containing protein 10 isoform X2 [Topomyia yanbarensis]|uniref:COMM domain-containing protein 10 isoform X2 n=1 Tax=Topomyia yanbarensis TaxID=2498891 RepID=UPI00273C29F5|nr:COMM domain-containing protein 10 isoform X2 [Topomyia yanbarensis]XP_058824024.1 COMM domain-containing protein 10 isoform X2 [Topomyia yanbarensis]
MNPAPTKPVLIRGTSVCRDRLSDECFSNLTEYLFKTIDNPTETSAEHTASDIETLQNDSQLNEQDFKLALQTLAYLVRRSLKFMLKPSTLQSDLRNRLLLDENKSNILVKHWIQATKIILDSLKPSEGDRGSEGSASNQLADVSWKVRAQLSSEPRQKDKLALGQLELKTTKKAINLELNSTEIVDFYNQLERIQAELDSLKSKA